MPLFILSFTFSFGFLHLFSIFLNPQPYTVLHLEQRTRSKLWWHLGFWSLYEVMCLQNMGDSKLYLQQCQPRGQTLTWSCTKRHVQHGVTLGFFFWTKPGTIGICWYLSTRTSLILNVNITTRLHGTDPNNRHYYAKLSFIF